MQINIRKREKLLEEEEEIIRKYKIRLEQKDTTVVFEMFEMMLEKLNQVQNKLTSIEVDVATIEECNQLADSNWSAKSKNDKKVRKELAEIGNTLTDIVNLAVKTEQDASGLAT